MATPIGVICSSVKSPQHPKLYTTIHRANHYKRDSVHLFMLTLKFSSKQLWLSHEKLNTSLGSRRFSLVCQTKERVGHCGDCSNISRGIMKLDARARQDIAFLASEFLKLDARAREDTVKVDRDVKRKAKRLQHVATILKNIAQSRLKSAADKYWSDGALEADLKRAGFAAKQRAMEDSLIALEFVKNIHDMMVSKMYRLKKDYINSNEVSRHIKLEKNGRTLGFFPGDVSTDPINAIQEVYWSIASALSEADGIDYTDPEELELLVAALIDLDAMDGKSSVSLLAECSNSPDVSTRRALANALSAAPSMWTLGNAGMGALQRLAEDSNPAIAEAAAKTINELKKQWEIEEVGRWRFMMNQISLIMSKDEDEDEDEDTSGTD